MHRPTFTRLAPAVAALLAVATLSGACGTQTSTQSSSPQPPATESAPSTTATPDTDDVETAPADPSTPKPVPEAYVPRQQPGSAAAYAELVARLEADVPAELRDDVPWPDLRNANPIVSQKQIFELWIWMAETLPEPNLVEIMAAPGSPSREDIAGIFGMIQAASVFETRTDPGYQAFDHLVVTFETAGLPLWLSRDIPEDAVVLYYSDSSGPVEVTDQDSGQLLEVRSATPTRTWLSIMVPTDVGWMLWRDQLIEPTDAELEVPDVAPPSPEAGNRVPEV